MICEMREIYRLRERERRERVRELEWWGRERYGSDRATDKSNNAWQ